MSEKPIRKNTIVSTTDKRLTLLEWLKQVQGQLNDLKEKGVKASFKVMTADEFIKSHENKPTGVDFAVIQESENDIYVIFGKYEILFNEESKESGSVHGTGVIGEVLINNEGNENMYLYGKGWIYFSKQSGIYHFDDCENNEATTQFANVDDIYNLENRVNGIEGSSNYKLLTSTPNNVNEVINAIGGVGGRGYGLGRVDTGNMSTAFGDISSNVAGKFNLFGFYVHDYEVYYSTGMAIIKQGSGEIENAISGTELKEAVRLATQKTYWHSVKIKGANGIFTFNAPSTLNTPVVTTEKLIELFNNNTWAGFGKLGTDMLFAIRLLNGNIEFIKADDTSASLGAFGTLEISDDVKEVK